MIHIAMTCILMFAPGAHAAPDTGTPTQTRPESVELLQARLDQLEARVDQLEAADAPPPVSSVVGWKGEVTVAEGDSVQDAVSYTGPVRVLGEVRGDAVSMVSDVLVGPHGVVHGDAVSFGGNIQVDSGGQIKGDRVALGPDEAALRGVLPGPIASGGVLLKGLARRLAMLLSFAGAGVLLVGFWPRQVDQIADLMMERPVWVGVAGGILAAILALVASLFAVTVVGLPVSLLIVLLLSIAWFMGFVALCKAAGDRFALTRGRGAWASFLAGAALITAVGMLPWVGTAVIVLLGLPALGAALLSRLGNRRDAL